MGPELWQASAAAWRILARRTTKAARRHIAQRRAAAHYVTM
jgi:hypothetical protein